MATLFRPREGYTGGVNELPTAGFEDAIKETHGVKAWLVERVRVDERFEGKPVWEGEVLVFEMEGHPSSQWCYTWSVDRKVTAVLHPGPVDSPVKAVRASILAEE